MSGDSPGPAFVYCQAETLTREQLANYELPHPRRSNMRELWRELFHSDSTFTAIVEVLEGRGLAVRPDGTYRVWDAYNILDQISRLAQIRADSPRRMQVSLVLFPALHLLYRLEETWWEAVEAARIGLNLAWRARYPTLITDPMTGKPRQETYDEIEQRLRPLQDAVRQEVRALAERFPTEQGFWREHVAGIAWLVTELREAHFEPLARLASDQLSAAVDLAEVRLVKTRRQVRALVGVVPPDVSGPALTAASFSISLKAFDTALDQLEQDLPTFNSAMPLPLRLGPAEPEELLRFLTDCGLQDWYTELSTAAWSQSVLWDMTEDQRIAVAYGRVRTLCTLFEEALLSLADSTGDAQFALAVEQAHMLRRRLVRFLRGPAGRSAAINIERVEDLVDANRIMPGIDASNMGARLSALGVPSRHATQGVSQTPEQVLASLVVIRNLTSHRFPIVRAGEREQWFWAWGDHLPAINQSVRWAALMLWALAGYFSETHQGDN